MESYYGQQAGSGIAGYNGIRYQRGHGFASALKGLWSFIKPALPFVGRQAVAAGGDIIGLMDDGSNFKTAAKTVLKRKAGDLAFNTVGKLVGQRGRGKRRKTKTCKKRVARSTSRRRIKGGKKRTGAKSSCASRKCKSLF